MGELNHIESNSTAVTRKTDANPEGKGLNGFLLDWYQSEPRGVVAKPRRQLLAEFFTSMLVLSAQFKYKPAIGTINHLYWMNGEWSLSLIAPDQWSEERRAAVILGGQNATRCRQWQMLLPRSKIELLAH